MGRWGELGLGLMIGTVLTVALVAAVRPGAVAVDGSAVRAAVRERLPVPKPRRDRALPDDSRDRDCQLADAVNGALSATVDGKDGGDGDFPTHEARLDALLDATRCQRLGRLYTLDADALTSVADVVERVARRSGRLRGEAASRGWATRSWAFGVELVLADAERLGPPGLRFAQAGVNAALESLERERPAIEDTAALLLITRTLRTRTPAPEDVFGALGLEALRRALADEAIPVEGPDAVDADVRAASAWWAQLGAYAAGELRSPPPSGTSALARAATPDGGGALADAWRTLERDTRALAAVLVVATSGAACAVPWHQAPTDPVSGEAFTFDAQGCAVVAPGRAYRVAPPVPSR